MLSIRLRLTIWYSVVLLCGLGLLGMAMWIGLRQHLTAEVDRKLSQRVQGLQTVLELEGKLGRAERFQEELSEYALEIPEGALLQMTDPDGDTMLGSTFDFGQVQAGENPAFQTVSRGGKGFRLLATQITYGGRNYAVRAASSLEELAGMLYFLRRLLLILSPAVLAIACLGGYWISRRALAPVDEITNAAKMISAQNLSRRLPVPDTGDEIQRMAKTWNELLERLESSVSKIRQFTADASHELRTPIALIRAAAELALRQQRTPQEYVQSLQGIQNEAERMTELTSSMLLLARSDAGSLEMPLGPTDIAEIVRSVVEENQPLAASRGILLRANVDGDAPSVIANEAGLHRILLILIENALRHTPHAGQIVVSTAATGRKVSLSVEDTGEGIPAEALNHVFERFYQADPARTGDAGAGLGLSIAQAIAQAHGSELSVQSESGMGTRFTLQLRS